MNSTNQFYAILLFCLVMLGCNAQTNTTPASTPKKSPSTVTSSAAKPALAATGNTGASGNKSTAAKTTTAKPTTTVKSTTTSPTKAVTAAKPTTPKPQNPTSTNNLKNTGTSTSIQSGGGKPINTSNQAPQTPTLPAKANTPSAPTPPTKPSEPSTPPAKTETTTTPTGGKKDRFENGGSTTTTPTTDNTTGNSKNRDPKPTDNTTTNTTGGSSKGGGVGDILGNILNNGGTFTEGDAANAIKEALLKGINIGVDKVSVTDGYFGNSLIKIPFPEEAKIIETTLRQVGMGSMIDNVILSSNRAAESAAKQALPIFTNSITQLTIKDAVNIVSNKQTDAATQFLQRTTTEPLVSAFKPSIKSALDKTLATKYWADVMGYYNKIPFVQKINPDLTDFVTRKAISGLFYMVAQEEAKIRKDPGARTSEILKKVFGNVKL